MNNNNLYNPGGMKLFALPRGKKDRINTRERNITDLGKITAAGAIYRSSLAPDHPLLYCGQQSMAVPFIRELLKSSSKPFVIIGSERDLDSTSCFYSLSWNEKVYSPNDYRAGNTIMKLNAAGSPSLALASRLNLWDDHQLVLCIGGGILMDAEILNLLNRLFPGYILVCDSFTRSVSVELGTQVLLQYIACFVCSSFSGSADEFIKILPKFKAEVYTNTTGFAVNANAGMFGHESHNMRGRSANISQSRTFEEKSVLEASELQKLQECGKTLIYNRDSGHVFLARIEDRVYKVI